MTQRYTVAGLALTGVMTAPLWADGSKVSYSTYGTPGLVEMPTAQSAPDAELTTTVSVFDNNTRTTVAFQLTPRLNASFRYSGLEGLGNVRNTLFDRSFDLSYRLLDETDRRPAVALGLRDFIGTGVYSGQYVVATKTVSPKVTVTGGVGWGRLGGSGGFINQRGTTNALGGQLESTNWFKGDASLFGGVSWQATDKFSLKAEYSSDAYRRERDANAFDINSKLNFGAEYRFNDNASVQAFYLYGSTFGAAINLISNPKQSAAPTGTHAAPFPVRARAAGAGRDLGWQTDPVAQRNARTLLAKMMENEGLTIEALDMSARTAQIHIRNGRYEFGAEAIGRTVRVLSQAMPDSIETFVIVPVVRGVPASSVTIQRRDAERFEHAPRGDEQILAAAQIGAAPAMRAARFDDTLYPKLTWGLGPDFKASFFDPDKPVRADLGLKLSAEYNLSPGLYVTGSLRQSLGGNLDDSDRVSNSVLPKVRSESNIYDREGQTALERLTLDYYFKPGRDLFGRVSAGYLESQYGGLSAELLWKPVDSAFAIGVEVNHVKQRDFDQGFGFRDYDVTTGHVSGYWDMGNGFHAQVDAGRYLAGDWGSTVALDREFANGWRVGAYATLTDVSFEDFGEGSFDKGLRFTIPLAPFLGQPTRQSYKAVIQPLTRDGGAKVHVDGRLYETVRDYHSSGLESTWGRFWR